MKKIKININLLGIFGVGIMIYAIIVKDPDKFTQGLIVAIYGLLSTEIRELKLNKEVK